ncbi:protein kinase [Nonomuraea sp. K274]|uniref:Protein kinase n=1 Tax=Nonomuraea cypriaca TaxID=1187855 RepID=A0A931AQL6_9ACTN|nr:protein kinase [Nonomuraea cypriaca]MBF8193142.1 protein kinase [Nonomuraea cypriaca]
MPGDPERLGGYWLAARLGAGGRGVVYDAYDDEGRRYAVTVPRGRAGHRFERVTCRHLAEVVAAGADDGVPYVVSEYVDGPELRSAVELHGPYTGEELVALAAALGAALCALHEAGLTHSGLNPESVLLAAEGPKVIELGLPAAGTVDGTCTYHAPEVLTGLEAGTAADVFAWGAVVLFAATGRDPFRGTSLGGVMHRLLTVDPDLSDLPDSLRELVGRALAKDPADRPSAAELKLDAKDPADRPSAAELKIDGAAGLRPPGGHTGPRALGEIAEEVYLALTPGQQEELPGLLLRLLDGDDPHDESDVLRPLMDAGLLVRRSIRVPPAETSVGKLVAVRDDRVAPASAALYRAWPRLRRWVADERDGMSVHREIRRAARNWSEHRRGRSRLYRGRRLGTALGWAATKRRHLRLNQLERDFINDSVALSEQRRKLLVPSVVAAGVVLAVAVSMTLVSVQGQSDLRDQLVEANARAVAARAEALRSSDPRTAMRLSVAAWRMSPVFEARAAVQASLAQPELGVFTDPAPDPRARYLLRGDELVRWDAGAVTVWDVAGGRRLASYTLPPGSTALSDDGRYAEDAGGRPFDVATGRAPVAGSYAISRGNRTKVYRGGEMLFDVADSKVALSADGARAAVSGLDGQVRLWQPARRTWIDAVHVRPRDGADAAAPAMAFTPDGSLLAVVGRDGLTLVELGRPAAARTKRAEAAGDRDTPRVAAGVPAAQVPVPDATGTPVFSPDGSLLALPGTGEVRVWNVAERRLAGTYPLTDPDHGLAFSADGRALRYLSGTGSVVSLDVSGLPAPVGDDRTVALSGNGRVAAKENGGSIELTDADERRPLGRIAAAGDLAFDAAGRLLAVAGDPVTVWDVAGGKPVATIGAGGDVPAVALSPRGDTLATARGRTLETWDVRDGRRVRVYEEAGDLALAFSPDGATLAAGANLLDLRTGASTPIDLAGSGEAEPTALAFSPDGRTLAFGLQGGRVLLWNVRERSRRGTIETGASPVDELRFSPDGALLAVNTTRTSLWDMSALREVGQLGSWAAGLAFSQDGRRLRGVALDGTVRESPVDPALAVQEVCARAGGPLSRAEWTRLIPETGYRDVC